MNLTRTKTIEQSITDTEESEHKLRKELGPVQLTVFGVGVIIGTGIFVLTGEAAGEKDVILMGASYVPSSWARSVIDQNMLCAQRVKSLLIGS